MLRVHAIPTYRVYRLCDNDFDHRLHPARPDEKLIKLEWPTYFTVGYADTHSLKRRVCSSRLL